jgi:hypothetical protein
VLVDAGATSIAAGKITDRRVVLTTLVAETAARVAHAGDALYHFTGTEKADRLLSAADKTDLTDGGTSSLHKHDVASGICFYFQGDLAVGDSLTLVVPVGKTIVSPYGSIFAATVNTGADLIIDIEKNGTSIYGTTPANRPTVGDADADGVGAVGAPDVLAISQFDRITAKVIQIGATIAGADVALTLVVV